MRVIEAISMAGNPYNEDMIRFGDHYVLLLDGSTGLKDNMIQGYPTDAVWFVTAVSEYISGSIHQGYDLHDLIRDLVAHLSREWNAMHADRTDALDMPSASIVLLREKADDTIEILNLGDCTTIVETASGDAHIIHDDRVSILDGMVVEKMKNLSKEMNLSVADTSRFIVDDLLANRSLKNAEGGYAILGFDPPFSLDIREYRKRDIQRICIFTDGMADHYATLKLSANALDFFDMVKGKGVCAVLEEVRARQDQDLSCSMYPRLKAKDDASIILVECHKDSI